MNLRQIFKCSENIVEGITYKLFVVGVLYIDDVEDDDIGYLEPKEKITKGKIRDFFEKRVRVAFLEPRLESWL